MLCNIPPRLKVWFVVTLRSKSVSSSKAETVSQGDLENAQPYFPRYISRVEKGVTVERLRYSSITELSAKFIFAIQKLEYIHGAMRQRSPVLTTSDQNQSRRPPILIDASLCCRSAQDLGIVPDKFLTLATSLH